MSSLVKCKILILIALLVPLCVPVFLVGRLWFALSLSRYDPQTIYSPNFSEDAFAKLQIGDSEKTVREVIGSPLREFEDRDFVFLVYSDIGNYSSRWQKAYHQRWIALDTNKQVVYLFRRLITTEYDPCSPLSRWKRDATQVYRSFAP